MIFYDIVMVTLVTLVTFLFNALLPADRKVTISGGKVTISGGKVTIIVMLTC
jgi:hypothetical protein